MEDTTSSKTEFKKQKMLILSGVLVIVLCLIIAWLVGWGYIPGNLDPVSIIGLGLAIGFAAICCGSWAITAAIAQRMPEYGDLEIRYEEGMEFFNDQEWEKALEVFIEVMGPEKNHKRALFYAAKCAMSLEDFERVKEYCQAYIKMQPRDREVWEMLAKAHKKLFEYEEAETALERAKQL